MLRLSEHKYLKWQSTMLVKIYVLSYCKYVAFHALILGRVCAFENDSSGKVYGFFVKYSPLVDGGPSGGSRVRGPPSAIAKFLHIFEIAFHKIKLRSSSVLVQLY